MRARAPTARGSLRPALVCFGLSAFLALQLPVLFGADERAHLLYVASVMDGRPPEPRPTSGPTSGCP